MTRLGGTTPGYPRWLTLGEMSRRLYMTTTDNKVYVVDTVNETFKWLAGQGSASNIDGVLASARFNDLRGLHADTTNASDVRIYVADRNNNKVRRININQGTVDTVAGSGPDGCVDGFTCRPGSAAPSTCLNFGPTRCGTSSTRTCTSPTLIATRSAKA